MNLSILIPTVNGREAEFNRLYNFLSNQIQNTNKVEIVSLKDNKEMSIGTKRDKLYKMANGKLSVMIDDDDMVSPDFVPVINEIVEAHDVDCIGYFENCLIDGHQRKSVISKECSEWSSIQKNGFDYQRTPFFKVPILTSLCQQVGVKDMRFAEDHDFAIRIHPLLKKEYFLYREMYYYRANSLTKEQHDQRYGITK